MDSSVIYQNGTNIGVGTTAPYAKLQVRAGTDQNLQFGPYGTGTYIQSSNDANTVVEPLMMSASSFAFLNGNVGIGTAGPNAKLEVNGTFLINQSGTTRVNVDSNGLVTVTGSLNITDNITVNGYIRGRPTDIAEMIPAADGEKIEAGDVVVADEKAVRKSRTAYDAAAIGVVSTEPGYVLGSHVDGVPLVLAGRVPVKVTGKGGAIRPGDMLTTSDKPGYAMKLTLLDINDAKDFADMKRIISENEKRKMSVIGKALESFDGEECKIIVLVGR
jgi:hypothetical protein